jgi:hypothetical protein
MPHAVKKIVKPERRCGGIEHLCILHFFFSLLQVR